MRNGMSPLDAGMDALKRIVRNYNNDLNKLKLMDMTYYILRKDGAYAGVSLWEGYQPSPWEKPEPTPHRIAVHDGTRRLEKTVSLMKGFSQEFPPFPKVPPQRLQELQSK
jgi:N4-(beta-N-acetylglucosaminyl)-L-asparaginase